VLRARRVEPGRPILDREETVAREVVALGKNGGVERLGGQALDRIALEGGDADAHWLWIEGP
jgi:hypothetical protein